MASISNNRFELHKRVTNGKQVTTVYSGKWTVEEERYVSFLCQQFKEGALDIKEGTTLRSFLADKLGCKAKRITKKYERTGYNGKLQFTDKRNTLAPSDLQWRRAKLQEMQHKFVESREAIIMNELQAPQQDERSIMTSALFNTGGAHRQLNLREPRHSTTGLGIGYQTAASMASLDLPLPPGLPMAPSALNVPLGMAGINQSIGAGADSDLVRADLLAQAYQQQQQPLGQPLAAEQRRLSASLMGAPSLDALRTEELMQRELRRSSLDSLLIRQEALLRARASMEMNALMLGSTAAGVPVSAPELPSLAAAASATATAQTGVRFREEAMQTLARKKARVAGPGLLF